MVIAFRGEVVPSAEPWMSKPVEGGASASTSRGRGPEASTSKTRSVRPSHDDAARAAGMPVPEPLIRLGGIWERLQMVPRSWVEPEAPAASAVAREEAPATTPPSQISAKSPAAAAPTAAASQSALADLLAEMRAERGDAPSDGPRMVLVVEGPDAGDQAVALPVGPADPAVAVAGEPPADGGPPAEVHFVAPGNRTPAAESGLVAAEKARLPEGDANRGQPAHDMGIVEEAIRVVLHSRSTFAGATGPADESVSDVAYFGREGPAPDRTVPADAEARFAENAAGKPAAEPDAKRELQLPGIPQGLADDRRPTRPTLQPGGKPELEVADIPQSVAGAGPPKTLTPEQAAQIGPVADPFLLGLNRADPRPYERRVPVRRRASVAMPRAPVVPDLQSSESAGVENPRAAAAEPERAVRASFEVIQPFEPPPPVEPPAAARADDAAAKAGAAAPARPGGSARWRIDPIGPGADPIRSGPPRAAAVEADRPACAWQERPIGELTMDIQPGGESPLPPDLAAECPPVPADAVYDILLSRTWGDVACPWDAPAMRRFPLHVEEVNLERYGYACRGLGVVQPAASAAHFFTCGAGLP
jgi:hypothetical protein